MYFASLKTQPPGLKPQLQGDPGARGHLRNLLLFPKLEFPFLLFLLPMRISFWQELIISHLLPVHLAIVSVC